LNVRSMYHHSQQQPQGIHHDMALAPLHLLAGVVASWPPFSVVFTLWLSIMAAEGVGSLPSASLTLGRKVSWMRSQVPSFLHRPRSYRGIPTLYSKEGGRGASCARCSRYGARTEPALGLPKGCRL
jgi:hypothetical protein